MTTKLSPRRHDTPRQYRDPLRSVRPVILAEAKQHGAKNVRVFGSYARGTQQKGSDIDLLVVMEEGRTLLDLIALERSLTKHLGQRIDILTERSLSPHLRERILSEARPL